MVKIKIIFPNYFSWLTLSKMSNKPYSNAWYGKEFLKTMGIAILLLIVRVTYGRAKNFL